MDWTPTSCHTSNYILQFYVHKNIVYYNFTYIKILFEIKTNCIFGININQLVNLKRNSCQLGIKKKKTKSWEECPEAHIEKPICVWYFWQQKASPGLIHTLVLNPSLTHSLTPVRKCLSLPSPWPSPASSLLPPHCTASSYPHWLIHNHT